MLPPPRAIFEIPCVFDTFRLSQFGLVTFQVLHSHVWLEATTWYSTVPDPCHLLSLRVTLDETFPSLGLCKCSVQTRCSHFQHRPSAIFHIEPALLYSTHMSLLPISPFFSPYPQI